MTKEEARDRLLMDVAILVADIHSKTCGFEVARHQKDRVREVRSALAGMWGEKK